MKKKQKKQSVKDYATDPNLSREVREFLKIVNTSGGRKLGEAGVPVTTVRYNGMIHDFGLLNGLATLPAVRSHIRQIGAELKKYLA